MPSPDEPCLILDAGAGLTLRELTLDDAPVIFAAVDADRAHLNRWLPWVESTREEADTRAFLEETARKRAAGRTRVFGLWEDGAGFCGTLGLAEIDRTDASLQIGYWISSAAQGRGLMSRACRAALRFSFLTLEMECVAICCAVGNQRSSAIPERLGFTFEGVLRRAQRLHGDFLDLRLYSLVRSDYLAGLSRADPEPPAAR